MRAVSAAVIAVALGLGSGLVASAEAQPAPMATAMAWLKAVRDGNEATLVAHTHFPVQVDVDSRRVGCRTRQAIERKRFSAITRRCIFGEALFRESIPMDLSVLSAAGWRVSSLSELPKPLRRFRMRLTALGRGAVLVSGPLPGDGLSYEVVIAIAGDGKVRAVFADGEAVE